MKKLILLSVLFSLNLFAQSSAPPSTEPIDPLDNYIDPATQLDYKVQYEKLNKLQREVLIGRCMMFTIQSEMGQSGEDAMSPSEIEAYENLIENKCKCIQDGFTWKTDSSTKGSCDEGTEAEKDLLLYTMDTCVGRMKLTDASCKKTMTDTCLADFRYQCYQYMTEPLEFSEEAKPVLNKCQFSDQTKNIKLECRSYCHTRNVCTVTQEEFKNRKIGNMYLLKKKSRSSCVKGSTYGVNTDNSMWVTNSCHGDFALQYKDPKCGFRPTCVPKPHVVDHIPEGGVQTLEMACNGEENEAGGKQFCKVTPFKVDKSGKLTDEPDANKVVTYVRDLSIVKKIGAAKCNKGGNAQAIDYNPRNKGLDGGWGIETQNHCHARFKVTVKWVRKLCTLAGQETTSKDTCCNGLYWDPTAKTCNVIPFNPTPLDDEALVKLEYPGGNQCNPRIPEAVQTLVDKYFVELGNYENLFTVLDAQSDAISSIEVEKAEGEEGEDGESTSSASSVESKISTYNAIKSLHDPIVLFRTEWSSALAQFKAAEEYTKKEYMDYVAYLEKVDKKENTAEDNLAIETNMFLGLDLQSAALKNQRVAKMFQLAYVKTLKEISDQYVFDLEKAAHIGQNVAWYCAHTENCSERNWLIRDPEKEEIVDFLHDTSYPWKLIEPRGKMLPKIGKVNKFMVDRKVYTNFEKGGGTANNTGIMGLPAFKEYFSYQEAKKTELPLFDKPSGEDGTKILELFRKYSHELPLREDSTLKDDPSMKEYFETTKDGALVGGLPLYCEEQNDYKVRIPIGKAVEPLRMLQVARLVRTYYGLFEEMFKANESCLVDVGADRDSRARDLDVNLGLDDRLIGSNRPNDSASGDAEGFAKNISGSLLGHMTSSFGKTAAGSFMDNLFGKRGSGSKLSDTNSGGDLNAIRKKNADKIAKLVKRRIKFKKDTALKGYKDSLDSAFGNSLSKKARTFASTNTKAGSGLKGFGGNNKAVGSSNRKEEGTKKTIDWGSKKYGATGSSRGSSNRNYGSGSNNNYGSSNRGSGMGGGSNSGMNGSDRDTDDILADVNNKKYDNNEEDSLFDRVTKRYIRTAYPVLLEKKKIK